MNNTSLHINYKLLSTNHMIGQLTSNLDKIRDAFENSSEEELLAILGDSSTEELITQMATELSELQTFLDEYSIKTVLL